MLEKYKISSALRADSLTVEEAFSDLIGEFGEPALLLRGLRKKEGLSQIGKEPYIDIVIVSADGKEYGISCKGTQAPSLAGGGIGGLKVIVPDLMPKVYKAVENFLKQILG